MWFEQNFDFFKSMFSFVGNQPKKNFMIYAWKWTNDWYIFPNKLKIHLPEKNGQVLSKIKNIFEKELMKIWTNVLNPKKRSCAINEIWISLDYLTVPVETSKNFHSEMAI